MAIPVIDFSKLNGDERAKTLAEIANACEEWGFFQLVNNGIAEELLERVKKVSSEFYKVEREENFKNSKVVNLLNESGDEKLENVDWEDVITLTDDNVSEWSYQTSGFKAFNGGGENNAFFGTKLCHYPPCPNPEKVTGLRAHTDAGGVILLFQDDEVGGLQVLKDGEWIDVQPLKNTIVINTGDQIEVLSNGRYKSVLAPCFEHH
ncbi:hypothetical protein GOBAR_AA12185 [Gossypium barbadense]|uniref:Fe2OG dioxygenase domain-containing protein n=1 Tax=Gossypium barbadense TaxID=3634 RepID=A0A2P5XYS7_GOSBA|nr:hypothetical protein GOBAR_AA12185 [Gossypium barbadense]